MSGRNEKRPRGRPPKPLSATVAQYTGSIGTPEEFEALKGVPPAQWPEKFRAHWPWFGAIAYPKPFYFDGAEFPRRTSGSLVPMARGTRAIRLFYEYLVGPVPEGHNLRRIPSRCFYPVCVNPYCHTPWPVYGGPIKNFNPLLEAPLPAPADPSYSPEDTEDLIGLAADYLHLLHDQPTLTAAQFAADLGFPVSEIELGLKLLQQRSAS